MVQAELNHGLPTPQLYIIHAKISLIFDKVHKTSYMYKNVHVTPAQLMTPGIGRNASCALDDFHFYI